MNFDGSYRDSDNCRVQHTAKKNRKNLEKLKTKTAIIYYFVFAILLAVARVQTCSTFVYNHSKATAVIISLTYLIGMITSPTEAIASTPEKITLSDAMYISTFLLLATPKSRDWSRELTSYSEPIQCYSQSDWLPSEQNLVYIADEIRRFGALSNSSDQMSENT